MKNKNLFPNVWRLESPRSSIDSMVGWWRLNLCSQDGALNASSSAEDKHCVLTWQKMTRRKGGTQIVKVFYKDI
jgi:hypothetical protein